MPWENIMRPIAASLIISAAASITLCAVYKIFPFLIPIFLGFAAALNIAVWLVLWVFSLFVSKKKYYEKPSKFYTGLLNFGYAYICEGARLKVRTSGLEKLPEKPFLLVTNHLSNLDNMVQALALRPRKIAYITKQSLFRIPIVGGIITRCCYISVDRKSLKSGKNSTEAAEDFINRGILSIGVYPEGTRGDGKTLGKFHAGCFKIALKTGCPVVVAAIQGTKNARKRMPFRSTRVSFDIIEVINPEGFKSVELSETVRKKIENYINGGEENDSSSLQSACL